MKLTFHNHYSPLVRTTNWGWGGVEDWKDYKLNYWLQAISSGPGKDSRQSRSCEGRVLMGGTRRIRPLDKLVTRMYRAV